MNDISASHAELPRSSYFNNSLRRARTAAEQRSHRYVTLEHLLYALLDDPDALSLLETMGADIPVIRGMTSEAINHRMSSLVVPNGRAPTFSYKFDSLMMSASEDAVRLGRREIDGALAVVGIAKDPENNASAFLTANGFNIGAALRYLGAMRGPAAPSQPRLPELPPAPLPRPPENSFTIPRNAEASDVLASVRNLLEAGERRDAGMTAQTSMRPPARAEPAFDPHRALALPNMPAFPPLARPAAQRREPRLGQPASPQQKGQKRGTPHTGASGGASVPVAALVEHIPRRMRNGVPEAIEIRIAKEEIAGLFEGGTRGTAKAAARAVSVRLLAPEGGFFIETMTPETQWLFDRPSFLSEEPFGQWVFTIVPNERGRYPLLAFISSRDIDENGIAKDVAVPEHVMEVRIRASWKSMFGGLFRTLFLLAVGGTMTEGCLYLMKIAGKIPHMPWQ